MYKHISTYTHSYLFDLCDVYTQGHLIATPGNQNIKILETKSMKFRQTESMSHHFAVNVCAFNHHLEKAESAHYILASGDIKGSISIWDITYHDKQFEFSKVDSIQCQEGVCNLVWKNANELYVSSMTANIYKYRFEAVVDENVNTSNQTIVDKVSTMDIDNEEKEVEKEIKTAQDTKSDSDDDFDIDMDADVDNDGGASPTKKVLKRSFVGSDEDTSPKEALKKLKNNLQADVK